MEKRFSIWANDLTDILSALSKEFKTPPVVMCVGSSSCPEDFLGPNVGTLLKKLGYKNDVYGCVGAEITSSNLSVAQEFVKSTHPTQKLLIVDASTSKHSSSLGQIVLKKDYVPFNPKLKNSNIQADLFLFGVCSVCGCSFPQMFYAKKLLTQKIATTISKALVRI